MSLSPPLPDLAALSASFESAHPGGVIAWAWQTFGDGLVVTASFEDAVLIDLVARHAPAAEVVLLDTGYLFAESLWFAEELRRRYDLNLRTVRPVNAPPNQWQHDTEGCCALRKVEPLHRTLFGRSAWITGIRRADGPTRATTPIVAADVLRGVVKINPLAAFTDGDVASYQQTHDLPVHPLTERGYPSIGCWPCTRPVSPGEDRRAGRWSGSAKTECGLHR